MVVVRPRAVLIITAVAALVVFAVVQDRVTAAGARRYVALQRAAIAGRGRAVTVDEIMRPAIQHSVQLGLVWSGVVLVSGVGIAAVAAARGAADRDSGTTLADPALRQAQGAPRLSSSGSRIPDPGAGAGPS